MSIGSTYIDGETPSWEFQTTWEYIDYSSIVKLDDIICDDKTRSFLQTFPEYLQENLKNATMKKREKDLIMTVLITNINKEIQIILRADTSSIDLSHIRRIEAKVDKLIHKRYYHFNSYKSFKISDDDLFKFACQDNRFKDICDKCKFTSLEEALTKYDNRDHHLEFEYMARVHNLSLWKFSKINIEKYIQENLNGFKIHEQKHDYVYFRDIFPRLYPHLQKIRKLQNEDFVKYFDKNIAEILRDIPIDMHLVGSSALRNFDSYGQDKKYINIINRIYHHIDTYIKKPQTIWDSPIILTDGKWLVEPIDESEIEPTDDIIWQPEIYHNQYFDYYMNELQPGGRLYMPRGLTGMIFKKIPL